MTNEAGAAYKGLAFFTKSPTPLLLPSRTEVIQAKAVSIPEL
jgi:hypothetical protein